ncbi:MAG: acyl-CoA dehydrogenase family protein [Pseudomonadales bacterium]
MDFDLTEEQVLLKDSISRFVSDNYDLESRRGYASSDTGFSTENWQQFAELGWLSLPFSEEHGGFGGNAVDLMVVMEELGKGLVVEPFLATVLLFGGALTRSGNAELQESLIPSIIDGSLHGALAYHERGSRYALNDVQTTATSNGDSYVLDGEKTVVFNAPAANKIIVSARTSGDRYDDNGISLFIVDANASGLESTPFKMMDGQKVCNVKLSSVAVTSADLVGELDAGLAILQSVSRNAIIALAAEAQGAMQILYESTVEYSKTREQFGVAIGSFQALQHRMVDMFAACEENRSLLYRAVCSMDEDEANLNERDIAMNVHALKTMVGRSGKKIGGEAIQIHGGMGMTDELAIGHYFKRLMMINTAFGDADYHQRQFASLANA